MITNRFSELAEKAGERYGLLVDAFRIIFNNTVMHPNFGQVSIRDKAVLEAYALARTYLNDETNHIEDELPEIAKTARRDALDVLRIETADDLSDELYEHILSISEHLSRELSVQIERDIAFLRQSLVMAALQISSSARSQSIPMRQAVMQYRIGNSRELRFYFHDRANRKWPSRKFVRTVWRQAMVDIYNDTILTTAAEYGCKEVEVCHAQAKAEVHGMRLSLAYNSELPNYSEIRGDVFHPNSESILVPVVR